MGIFLSTMNYFTFCHIHNVANIIALFIKINKVINKKKQNMPILSFNSIKHCIQEKFFRLYLEHILFFISFPHKKVFFILLSWNIWQDGCFFSCFFLFLRCTQKSSVAYRAIKKHLYLSISMRIWSNNVFVLTTSYIVIAYTNIKSKWKYN